MKLKGFLISGLVWIVLFVLFVIVTMPAGGPSGVAGVTSRGGYMIAIRPPPTANGQLQIVIFNADSYLHPKAATSRYITGNFQSEVNEMDLSVAQWDAINQLREQWCLSKPPFSKLENSDAFYDVGFRCQGPGGPWSSRVKIPLAELPSEFQEVVRVLSGD